MPSKNKNAQTITDKLSDAAMQGGILLMAAAATLGMLELPDRSAGRAIVVPNQPVFAAANQGIENQAENNQLRREGDEAAPHYLSYSIIQRTPSRSGKH